MPPAIENSGAGAWGADVCLPVARAVPCAAQFGMIARELASAKRQQIAPPRICQYERLFTVAAIRRFSHRMMPQKFSIRNLRFPDHIITWISAHILAISGPSRVNLLSGRGGGLVRSCAFAAAAESGHKVVVSSAAGQARVVVGRGG